MVGEPLTLWSPAADINRGATSEDGSRCKVGWPAPRSGTSLYVRSSAISHLAFDVRFGLKADIRDRTSNVRFTPRSGDVAVEVKPSLAARSRQGAERPPRRVRYQLVRLWRAHRPPQRPGSALCSRFWCAPAAIGLRGGCRFGDRSAWPSFGARNACHRGWGRAR